MKKALAVGLACFVAFSAAVPVMAAEVATCGLVATTAAMWRS